MHIDSRLELTINNELMHGSVRSQLEYAGSGSVRSRSLAPVAFFARHPHTRCSGNLLARCQPADKTAGWRHLPPSRSSSAREPSMNRWWWRARLRPQRLLRAPRPAPVGSSRSADLARQHREPSHRRPERHLDSHHHAAGLEGVHDPAEPAESDGLVHGGGGVARLPHRPQHGHQQVADVGVGPGAWLAFHPRHGVRRRVNVPPKPHVD